jgi:hypothetical protein
MNAEQREQFERDGLTCLRRAVDPSAVAKIRDRVWLEAERKRAICRDDRSTWKRVPPSILKRVIHSEGLFEPLLSRAVREGIDSLLGADRWEKPKAVGQLLMSPPDAADWVLPHKVWHMDFPAPGWLDNALPGVQLFVFLDHLETAQGGTIFVTGSHRLVMELAERRSPEFAGHSAELRKALGRRVPWLRDLWREGAASDRRDRFMAQATEHEGVPLRVLEPTGQPGDVLFMHPWLLHNASPNCSDQMRMVATERLTAKGVSFFKWNRPPDA